MCWVLRRLAGIFKYPVFSTGSFCLSFVRMLIFVSFMWLVSYCFLWLMEAVTLQLSWMWQLGKRDEMPPGWIPRQSLKKTCTQTLETSSRVCMNSQKWSKKTEWLKEERKLYVCSSISQRRPVALHFNSAGVNLGLLLISHVSHLHFVPLNPCTDQLLHHFDGNSGWFSAVYDFIFFFFNTIKQGIPSVR